MDSLFGIFGGILGALFILFCFAFVVGIFGLLFYTIIRKFQESAATNARNNALPVQDVLAKVLSKRSQVSGEYRYTTYYVTFELTDGQRAEFELKGPEFGVLMEGDFGTLRHQGTRYLGFQRQL
jgi:hypothetical protein